MRVLSSPFHFACQLAALAISVSAETESKVAEIDLIIPLPNTTYQAGENDRFPMVWAVRNPSQWQSGTAELAYSVEPNAKGFLGSSGSLSLNKLNSSDEQVYYLAANIVAEPGNDFNVTWFVSGAKCDSDKGFGHGNDSPVSAFIFSVKPGGQKAEFSSAAAGGNCKSRTALAYKYGIATDDAKESCRAFDEDEPYPEPDACSLKVADSAAATVQKSLDDQLKKLCDDRPLSHICPVPKTSTNSTGTDKKNAAPAARLDAGTLLLGLGLSMVAFRGIFLS